MGRGMVVLLCFPVGGGPACLGVPGQAGGAGLARLVAAPVAAAPGRGQPVGAGASGVDAVEDVLVPAAAVVRPQTADVADAVPSGVRVPCATLGDAGVALATSKATGKALLQGGPLGGLLGGEDESGHVGFLWLLGRLPAPLKGRILGRQH